MCNLIILTSILVILQNKFNYLHAYEDLHQNLLDIDIQTNLIEFKRIAKTIQLIPSGGMVTWRRRLMTIKLAMRAIIDGIEGDFLETVRTHNFRYFRYCEKHNL